MILQSKNVYYNEQFQPLQIEIQGDRIRQIHPYNELPADADYGSLRLIPGMIDVHTHGYMGQDCSHATREWLDAWTAYLPSEGVTSVAAAISSAPWDEILEGLKAIGDYIEHPEANHDAGPDTVRTSILGVYEEGPFISQSHKGAQRGDCQVIPTIDIIDEMRAACHNHLIYVMVAPEELQGDYRVIEYCSELGIPVSLGHTGATYEVCEEAVAHGAISFTHTFNGMTGLHHRSPGVAGAALYFEDCYAELICDGVHVHKVPASILAKVKGKDKLILVTDAVALKGLPKEAYQVNGQQRVIFEDGVCRLENGTIAGSCHRLNRILRYAIEEANIPLTTAVNAVTINPYRLLNLQDRGLIEPGYRADLVILGEDYEPEAVWIKGKKYHKQ